MNWVLYVVLASSTASDKAINATPVPMATEQLCNEAKNKLFESYRRSNTPNWIMVIEYLNPLERSTSVSGDDWSGVTAGLTSRGRAAALKKRPCKVSRMRRRRTCTQAARARHRARGATLRKPAARPRLRPTNNAAAP
jgi:hypothetical protein